MRLPSIMFILVVAFLVISTMDYEDELMEQDLYCKMVSEGTWGDYNENYDEICDTSGVEETAETEGQISQQQFGQEEPINHREVYGAMGGGDSNL